MLDAGHGGGGICVLQTHFYVLFLFLFLSFFLNSELSLVMISNDQNSHFGCFCTFLLF